jgi:type II secretory ATPase GspE/PulE/Tfp pilus assembly ATPase PilB-like protein
MRRTQPQLGEVLLQQGAISEQQLMQAVQFHRDKGCRLGEALIRLGLCSDVHIARALAAQLDMPFVDLAKTPPVPAALQQLSKEKAAQWGVVPVRIEGQRLVVAARNPFDFTLDETVRRETGYPVLVVYAAESQIADALARYERLTLWSRPESGTRRASLPVHTNIRTLPRMAVRGAVRTGAQTGSADTTAAFIQQVLARGATEIYFACTAEGVEVRCRAEGALFRHAALPGAPGAALVAQVKAHCGIDPQASGPAHAGSWILELGEERVKLGCTSLRTTDGEILSLRVLSPAPAPVPLGELGLDPETVDRLAALLAERRGLLLVCGPAQSGRSTVLRSMLAHCRQDDCHVLTVEAEPELPLRGAQQLLPASRAPGAAARLVRAALDQKPDILLIDDVMDAETAAAACEWAATGRLVLASISAADALGGVARLLDLDIAPAGAGAALSAAIGLRLVPTVCPACAERVELPSEAAGEGWRRGRGCDACAYRGVRGQALLHELLVIDDDFRRLLTRGVLPSRLARFAARRGYRTLREKALRAACGPIEADSLPRPAPPPALAAP